MKCNILTFLEACTKYVDVKEETIRTIAEKYGMGRTTLHRFMLVSLKDANPDLYIRVSNKLKYNKEQRSTRGGQSTKRKFAEAKKKLKKKPQLRKEFKI